MLLSALSKAMWSNGLLSAPLWAGEMDHLWETHRAFTMGSLLLSTTKRGR